MAPAASKTRDNQYFNVGVQGRKTGITLKDTGVRDEHGMEPIDGIFSSPEKSPPKRNNARQQLDKTLTSSDMDVQQSSMPEPADVLSARKSSIRPGRASIFPPPMGRSPIKTSLGSSPRRQSSMGPPSAMRRTSKTPDRAISHPTVARRLDFGAGEERIARVNGSGSRNRGKPRPDVFALPVSPEPPRSKKRTHDESLVDEDTLPEESELQVNGFGGDSPLPAGGDESLQMIADGEETEVDEEHVEDSTEIPEPEPEPEPVPQLPKGRGKGRKSLEQKEVHVPNKGMGRPKKSQGLVSAKPVSTALPARSRKAGQSRSATNGHITDESTMEVDQSFEEPSIEEPLAEQFTEDESEEKLEETLEDTQEQEPSPEPEPVPSKKKRGRPKSGSKLEIHQDEPQEPVELPERPAKKARRAPAPKKPPPSQRDPNARITAKTNSAQSKQKAKQKEDMPPPPLPSQREIHRSGSRQQSQARSLQILRQGTPFDDVGARTTRSGRISAKPVEFWRNERIEYAHDGTKKEIIRAEDVEEPKRPARRNATRKRTTKRSESVTEEEEMGLEPEEWELNEGVIQGWVNGWDEKQGTIVDEGRRSEDIAFSAARIQTREVAGANFRYSKILGLPYFGAGMVDIPPHGSKRSKNARKMYMAFCVLSGKVNVTVGDTEFAINKGGVWMVPRGNFYSITNENEVPARLFFAQGCEVEIEASGAAAAAAAAAAARGA